MYPDFFVLIMHFQEERFSNNHIYAYVKMDHGDLLVAVALLLSLLAEMAVPVFPSESLSVQHSCSSVKTPC